MISGIFNFNADLIRDLVVLLFSTLDNFKIKCCEFLNLMKFILHLFQSIEATKSILNEDLLNNIEGDLIKETKILQQQWISAEFQEKLKNYMKNQEW